MKDFTISKSITDRTDANLNIYMRQISNYKLLTQDQEVELANRIRQNDPKALVELVNSNLRYVISVAKSYQKCGLDLLDLIEAGNIGLITAANKFDEKRGFKFISFATYWIHQAIMDELNKYGRTIRIPANVINEKKKIMKAANRFAHKHKRNPTTFELAEELGLPEYVVTSTFDSTTTVSIDTLIDSESGYCIGDTISDGSDPYENFTTTHYRDTIDFALYSPEIDEKSRNVLKHTFGYDAEEMSIRDIAEEENMTEQQVYQAKYKAIKKLKDISGPNDPRI